MRLKSTSFRLDGEWSLSGGVEASDTPEDPAVEGLASSSRLAMLFLRTGTPSGQEH